MRTRAFIVACGLAALPSTGMAQETPAAARASETVDPAAKEFIERVRANIRTVLDLSCTVEQRITDGGETTVSTGEFAAVFMRPAGGGPGAELKQFRIAVDGEKGRIVRAFDGKAATMLDLGSKTFAKLETDQAFPTRDSGNVVPMWALTDILATPGARIVAARMLPDAKVDGVACRVVEYTVESPAGAPAEDVKEPLRLVLRQVRHVGAEDLLPRRLESWTTFTGDGRQDLAPRSFVGIFTDVKANAKPAEETFRLAAAEGFKTVEADANSMGVPSDEPPKLKFAAGDAAPAFALKDSEGKETTLASLKGRVVLLDFWATWCPPCKAAMPSIQKLHDRYKGKAVSIIGVNTWERGAADIAAKYMAKNSFTYGLLLKGDSLATTYGVSGIPTLVLIGPDGKILHIGVGFGPNEEAHLAELIDKALGGA